MNLLKTSALVVAVGLALYGCKPSASMEEPKPYNEGIHVIPQPVELTQTAEGVITLTKDFKFIASGEELTKVASFFAEKIRTSTGYSMSIEESSSEPSREIALLLVGEDVVPQAEGYKLDVTVDSGVQIQASTPRGIFWGLQTLMQLLPAEIESTSRVKNIAWAIPFVSITDYPRLEYRGQHFDVSRHFLTVEQLKRNIDIMSMLKLNKMHWHLTDDQGWRIEIKQYPRLTEVGSIRTEADGTKYGPFFYTQEEVKDIVAYAKERFVEVIPEIELPGHSAAALAAYPYLGCNGEDFPYEVRNVWDISRETYCAGKDTVFAFLKNVIEEVIPLFESEFFHIGGDEAPKESWKRCPLCQERIRKEGLKDEYELQSYFIHRIEEVLVAHNKRMIGWEEILEGGLAPSATVMSWTGEAGGIKSANMGHNIIMTPASEGLYLDHYQGDSNVEPLAICCYSPIQKVYDYDPVPAEIDEDKRHLVLGVQGNVWGEYIYTPEYYEYLAHPRMAAVAEIGWTPLERKDISDFLRRLDNLLVRYDAHGINYFIPQPEQPDRLSINTVAFVGDSVQIPLETVYPVHKILYTLDGSEPTAESALVYDRPITFATDGELKVRSMILSGKLSEVRTIKILKQEYAPAVEEPVGLVQGLNFRITQSRFTNSDELLAYTGENKTMVVTEMQKTHQPMFTEPMIEHISSKFNYFGAIYTGYIRIPEDGVYRFSTTHNKLWIDGKELIDNEGLIKKYPRTDVSIALAKGLHKLMITHVSSIQGGYPTSWNDMRFQWSRFDQGQPLGWVPDEVLFCVPGAE